MVEKTSSKSKNIKFHKVSTFRPKSPGGEKWLGKVIPVLDHGFVYLVDYMGSDREIERAARVSYTVGTRKVRATRELLRYLMRHRHTSPFEMVEFKFHAKMPIFVARQWVRHRTASINEQSGRYSVLSNEFYLPDKKVIAAQSTLNKQGREGVFNIKLSHRVLDILSSEQELTYRNYEELLGMDLAREIARINLPLSVYTQWYWKMDLHNLLHFLKLRMDSHAQWEIRQYASAIAKIVADTVPLTWEAFEDYILNSTAISTQEQKVLIKLINNKFNKDEIIHLAEKNGIDSKLEQLEFVSKLEKIGLIK